MEVEDLFVVTYGWLVREVEFNVEVDGLFVEAYCGWSLG